MTSRRASLALVWVAAILAVLCAAHGTASAQNEPLKPYVLLILDTSGSMDTNTNAGPASCPGAGNTRMGHAKCAIQNIANSYGDMVLGLGRFRQSTSSTSCPCSMSTVSCSGCSSSTGSGCTATMGSDARFELLTPILDNNNAAVVRWTDFSCGTCGTNVANNPEIFSGGWTPIAGSLKGAKRYFQGLQASDGTSIWPVGQPGFDPIRNDPLKDRFLPSGRQCRPYIVISLTDGEETCAAFTETTGAAASLLTTVVDGQTYRIETRAIGFGVTAPDASIEGIAAAGGGYPGAYAQNEEELQLEISRIIADAIQFERCNDLDDDCDLLIDEDFPNKGQACHDGGVGICRGTGVFVCNPAGTGTECMITNPGQPPGVEVCNGLDDDCDGRIDEEGVCVGCTGVELCNGHDDDCDGRVDENLVRPCGTNLGVCMAGTERCEDGEWVGCTATTGTTETCNGVDDDCDGTIDGFAEACVEIAGNNPGVGECRPGTRVCPPDGSGVWGACLGEVGPQLEVCDTLDNDCDGETDEDTGGGTCTADCGVGTIRCVAGTLVCETTGTPQPEVCNGIDDDCDGTIDEGVPTGGPCDGNGTICGGTLVCQNGGYVCVGSVVQPELCNCLDDDCDTQIDEGNLCPTGSTCVHPNQSGFACQCAQPCAGGEFPCPLGRVCVDDFCLVDPCYGVTCDPQPDGDRRECVGGECVRSCDLVTCPPGFVCYGPDGACRPDDCRTFPERCGADELCVAGACVDDPCAGVSCPSGEYCTGGTCYRSCAGVVCPQGQRCRFGVCEPDPCGGPCPGSQICNDESGTCGPNPCPNQMCPQGEWCNPQHGGCEQDPCLGVTCPGPDEVCAGGTCDLPPVAPDAGVDGDTAEYVTAGGGGGCVAGCAAGGGGGGGAALLALAVGLAIRRRRRRGDGAAAEVRS